MTIQNNKSNDNLNGAISSSDSNTQSTGMLTFGVGAISSSDSNTQSTGMLTFGVGAISSSDSNTQSTGMLTLGVGAISSSSSNTQSTGMLTLGVPALCSNIGIIPEGRVSVDIPNNTKNTVKKVKNFINNQKIPSNVEILLKIDSQGKIILKYEAALLKYFSAYSCFPKSNYHDHNDYSNNGGEGFGILIGDSNPMPIEVC